MNEREVREIKRRFRPEKSNIPTIYGCYVNESRQIVTKFSQSILLSDMDESEKLLKVMKKTLSGGLGTNLVDIEFSTKQVTDSDKHKLLMALRDTRLADESSRDKFYDRVVESTELESSYCILIACDVYDVFDHTKDGEGESSTVFPYIVCSICPIKNTPDTLTFRESDNLFHSLSAAAVLASPELGFMFPSFDERRANIYHALYYTRSLTNNKARFIDGIFGTTPPMPTVVQRATFNQCLKEGLKDECDLHVIRSVHRGISELQAIHKETKNPEPLLISRSSVTEILENCGVEEQGINEFKKAFDRDFGANAELTPKNIVNTARFELKSPDVTIKVNPERSDLITTQVINGVNYILIRAEEGVEVNGVDVYVEKGGNS